MSDLLSLLRLGAGGLAAQHRGVAVAANNAANVNSAGYSRQRVDLRAELAAPLVGGVRANGAQRYADELLATRQRAGQAALGFSRNLAPALEDLEARLVTASPPLDGLVAGLWQALEHASARPTDPLVRAAAIGAARELATGLNRHAVELGQARADADARLREGGAAATAAIHEVAALNAAVQTSGDPVLRDRRDVAAGRLAELVGGTGRLDPDGHLRWTLDDGTVLVDGTRGATLATTPDPATGLLRVEVVDGSARRDVTAGLRQGQLGADLQLRDVDAAGLLARVDQLAHDVATGLNAVHAAHAGLDGVAGRPLFTAPAAVTGAAAGLAVDPALAADPERLALARVGSGPGDNQGALALLAMRDQAIASGGTQTLGAAAIDILGEVGRRASEARGAHTRDAAIAEHVAGLRDSLAGVDLDEELASLVHFQHAAEAMTRFLSAIDAMLGDLLHRL